MDLLIEIAIKILNQLENVGNNPIRKINQKLVNGG